MLIVTAPWIFSFSALSFGIGYTLLMYSKDGDMDLLSNQKKKLKLKNDFSETELWDALQSHISSETTEVTWNTSMFVSIISSLIFVGLLSYSKKHPLTSSTVGLLWIISLLSVFCLQDLIIRWKAAHRKSASTFEKLALVEKLRWSRTF